MHKLLSQNSQPGSFSQVRGFFTRDISIQLAPNSSLQLICVPSLCAQIGGIKTRLPVKQFKVKNQKESPGLF